MLLNLSQRLLPIVIEGVEEVGHVRGKGPSLDLAPVDAHARAQEEAVDGGQGHDPAADQGHQERESPARDPHEGGGLDHDEGQGLGTGADHAHALLYAGAAHDQEDGQEHHQEDDHGPLQEVSTNVQGQGAAKGLGHVRDRCLEAGVVDHGIVGLRTKRNSPLRCLPRGLSVVGPCLRTLTERDQSLNKTADLHLLTSLGVGVPHPASHLRFASAVAHALWAEGRDEDAPALHPRSVDLAHEVALVTDQNVTRANDREAEKERKIKSHQGPAVIGM